MPVQHVTIKELVTANRKYLAAHLLGAEMYSTCKYDYSREYPVGTPHRCSIGAVMSDDTISAVHDCRVNEGSSVGQLRGSLLEFEDGDAQQVARITQMLHDVWGYREERPLECYLKGGIRSLGNENFLKLPGFVQTFLIANKHVVASKKLFVDWIEYIAAHYKVDKKAA